MALSVGMRVAGANKVEGTIGTNEILASKHDILLRKRSNKGTLRAPFWFFTILSSFVTAKGVQ